MKIDWSRTEVRVKETGRARWIRGVEIEPTWTHKAVEDNDLWYVWTGRARMSTRAGPVTLESGACLWLRPGWVYDARQEPENPIGLDYVHFDLLDSNGKCRPFDEPMPPELLTPFSPSMVSAGISRIGELTHGLNVIDTTKYPEAGHTANLLLKALLIDLDAACDHQGGANAVGLRSVQHQLVQKIAAQIAVAPGETPPVSELAASAGYSTDHFIRVFRRFYGKTPKEFIVEARLNRARELLKNTNLTATHISRLLGYKEFKFFSRQFTEKVSMTPTQYRQMRRGQS